MKKIILVTGGAGFIGSKLIVSLLKESKNYNIISLDNYSSGTRLNHVKNKRIRYIKGSTVDIEKLLNKYKINIDTIFHFGEFSRIHQSFDEVKECIKSNITGTGNLINFCLTNKIRIIYSATSASLGNNGEDQNLSPYAFTKSKNLKLLIQLNKWFDLKYEILYFYNVYGPGQIETGPMATVIGIFENKVKKNLPLTVVKTGNQKRQFTHIDDTIRACIFVWKKSLNKHYSITSKKSYKIIEIAKFFSNKILFIKKRKGEREIPSNPNKIQGIKITSIKCKVDIKDYIENFLKKF